MDQNIKKIQNIHSINWLIKYMESLGYKDIADGVCLGLSYMGMHAMLLDELGAFVDRLQLIKDIFYNKNIALSNWQKSNILAFLDGVMLYQTFQSSSAFCVMLDIIKARHINWKHVFDIVKPIVFDKKQLNIYNIYKHAGCYQTKELFSFITVLEEHLLKLMLNKTVDLNCNNKIPVLLLCNKHAIVLGYNYVNNTWNIIDLGGLRTEVNWSSDIKVSYDKQQIIYLIYMAFTGLHVAPPKANINIGIEIYLTGCSKTQVNIIKKQLHRSINKDHSWLIINSIIKNKLGLTVVGETWLYSACFRGHYSIAKRLIMSKAEVDLAASKTGISPLLIAAQSGHYDIVCLLVKFGANINTFSNIGVTPLCIAVFNGYTKIVKFLLQYGAKINYQPGSLEISPLLMAAQNGYCDIVHLLLKYNAKVNTPDSSGTRALHMAAQNGHNDVVSALINATADVNVTDVRGITPLHIACYNGHRFIVQKLIQFKANIYKTTKQQSFTPLYIANKNNHNKIVRLLKQVDTNIVEDINNRMRYLAINI